VNAPVNTSANGTVYPVGLRLAGRRVTVVGGGTVAQRRIGGLLTAGADVLIVSPHLTASLEAMAAAGQLRWASRTYEKGDVEGAWYVLACTDDPDVNAAVAADAEARRILCQRADDAGGSTAWTPAVGRHDDVTVAVFGGGDPRRASAVRDGVMERLRDGGLATPRYRGKTGRVVLVGAGPGDADLITVRGRRLLADADLVVADRLVPLALLDELPAHVEVVDVGKIPRGRAAAQEEINDLLVRNAKSGKVVVRLKGGDPYVFGRGFEELAACAAAGIPCSVVPGVSSAIAAPAAAGVPVTHRGVAQEFTVVAGHLPPEDPRTLVDWTALGRGSGTIVLLMAVEHLSAIGRALIAHGRDSCTNVAIVENGTMDRERVIDATLATMAEVAAHHRVRPPAVVVVGDVVAMARGAHEGARAAIGT
jgi:uroporphyrin-III C-methyltransferase / precorrin-2 dehydrogenase / sirohydrochlorin ferrochelatase